MSVIVKVYLTDEQYQRYLKQADFEHRSLSNFAEYSMQRRCDQNPAKRTRTPQIQEMGNDGAVANDA